jgi:hypothetical protein
MKSGVTFEINVLQRLAAEQRAAIQQAQRHRTTSPYYCSSPRLRQRIYQYHIYII